MFSIDADFGTFEKWMRMMERRGRYLYPSSASACGTERI
jgi:hypothetical protein